MEIQKFEEGVLVRLAGPFNLEDTLDNGQSFRWLAEGDLEYTGIAYGRRINVRLMGEDLYIYPTTEEIFDKLWRRYFDLDTDYLLMHQELLGKDEHLDVALAFSPGLRMLHQEPWEMIISFIISANNNIARIKKSVEMLCESFGTPISGGGYAFPTPHQLSGARLDQLRACGLGYRDRYVQETARRFASGEVDLHHLQQLDREQLRSSLLTLSGVGKKVAQCIMLFGYGFEEEVPEDTWIKKIVSLLYSDESDGHTIESFFRYKFGKYSGYAQQVLFHWARKSRLGR